MLACEPSLRDAPDLIGALRFAGDGIGDARRFCEGLAAAAIARGGEMRLNSKVTHLLVENGKVCGVRLGDEEIRGIVVLAAGVSAARLARPLGLNLPIRPAKGYSLTLDASGQADSRNICWSIRPRILALPH